jgi:quercetin dioxygenase-like cupin family protein
MARGYRSARWRIADDGAIVNAVAAGGDVLENPVTGERAVFRRTAADTRGEALEYDLYFRPQGFVVREHLHPSQDELHDVVEGRLGLVLEGEERLLEPGDSLVVKAGTPHRLFPVDEGQVHVRFELTPALRTQELLELFFRLAREGKVSKAGNPGLLELAVIAREYEPEGYATKPPLAVQRVLFGSLAVLARLLGRGP